MSDDDGTERTDIMDYDQLAERVTAIEVSRALEDDAEIMLLDTALDHYQAIIMRLEKENERLRGVIRQYQIDRQPELEKTNE